jgi:hypothetical protein
MTAEDKKKEIEKAGSVLYLLEDLDKFAENIKKIEEK